MDETQGGYWGDLNAEKMANCNLGNGLSMDDSDEYKFTHTRRGVAYIIVNHKTAGTETVRSGSDIDLKKFEDMFRKYGFELRIHTDISTRVLKAILDEAREEDWSDCDCFAMAISSHGEFKLRTDYKMKEKVREDVIHTTDGEIETRKLLEHFIDEKCPTLEGKPRLFFIQACRGNTTDSGQEIQVVTKKPSPSKSGNPKDETDARPGSPIGFPMPAWQQNSYYSENIAVHTKSAGASPYPVVKSAAVSSVPAVEKLNDVIVTPAPCYKDFLVMYATPPGFYAFRRPAQGSWFVSELCKVLNKSSGKKSLLRELTYVAGSVARDMQSRCKDKSQDAKKQTPVIYSMLTKDIMLKHKPHSKK